MRRRRRDYLKRLSLGRGFEAAAYFVDLPAVLLPLQMKLALEGEKQAQARDEAESQHAVLQDILHYLFWHDFPPLNAPILMRAFADARLFERLQTLLAADDMLNSHTEVTFDDHPFAAGNDAVIDDHLHG